MKKLLVQVFVFCFHFSCFAQSFQSIHFTIQKCADGVYAAIAKNGGYAISNAGLIDMGDATLIFDTFFSPDAATDLQKVSFQLTGHKVTYIVNSHYHSDHIAGNQVFKNATIISTEVTRELISKYQLKEITDDATAPNKIEEIKKKNISAISSWDLEENAIWKAYYEVKLKYNHSLKTILPELTFNNSLILHGTKRNVLLLSYGKGHTESDLFLYLPAEQIAFLGDLLFIKYQPYLGDGDPDKWNEYLDRITRLNPKLLVPGHGPVGTLSDMGMMKQYFEAIKTAATGYQKSGTLPENDLNMKPLPPFDKWHYSEFYSQNVIFEYNRIYKR